jgi:hypothetical protein
VIIQVFSSGLQFFCISLACVAESNRSSFSVFSAIFETLPIKSQSFISKSFFSENSFISLLISSKFSFEISTFCFKLDFIKSTDFSDNQESFKESIVLSIFQFSSKLPESFLKISSGKIFFSF